MIQGKYIILKSGLPVLLSIASVHSDNYKKKDCEFAGYFKYDGKNFECSGESKSLGLTCGKNDAEILKTFFK
jgi:hypothetical protein